MILIACRIALPYVNFFSQIKNNCFFIMMLHQLHLKAVCDENSMKFNKFIVVLIFDATSEYLAGIIVLFLVFEMAELVFSTVPIVFGMKTMNSCPHNDFRSMLSLCRYADDLNIAVQENTFEAVAAKHSKTLNSVGNYYRANHLNPNAGKMENLT